MDYKDIERLKFTLSNLARNGCKLHIPTYGMKGKIVGIGFKPFWTYPNDSKIEKIEINFVDKYGRIIPFNFYNVIGYNVVTHDSNRFETSKNISLDIHVYSPHKEGSGEPYDKVRIDINEK